MPRAKKIGLYLAILHLIGFIVTTISVNLSTDPQAALLWSTFAVLDLPISLLYFFGKFYAKFTNSLGDTLLAQLLYFPHVLHGLLGTIWWYFLPSLITPKKIGGIWGKKSAS